MHVHGPGNELHIHANSLSRLQQNDRGRGVSAQSASDNASGELARSGHIAASEIVRLTDALQRIPEVREEKVAEVAARLAAGNYVTPESAEKTASAILES